MITLGEEAAGQVRDLRAFYERTGRPDAIRNLLSSLLRAADQIEQNPNAGLIAPRPYPTLAREGRRWIKQGRYWFAYTLSVPPIIVGVFFETADLPRRAGS